MTNTNTKYAVIDHVGQVANVSEIYTKAYELASEYTTYTLKEVCKKSSPYAKEITNKMKWYHRYNRKPDIVFIICGTYNRNVMMAQDAWEDRGIPTVIVEEEPNPTYYFGMKVSKYRRCAMIWGEALGWSFSAPLIRDEKVNYKGEMNLARPIEEEKNRTDESCGKAVRYTSPETFQKRFLEVASEEECIEFFQHYRWLYENNLLAESLECDYTICPTCGRPIRLGTAEEIACDYCDTVVTSEVVETYYDDSYENEEF